MSFGAFSGGLPQRLGGSKEEGWTATQHARVCADLLAAVRTLPYATLVADGTTITSYRAMPGLAAASQPTITLFSPGIWTVEFDDGPQDEYEITGPVKIVASRGSGIDSGVIVNTSVLANLSHTVYVALRDNAGAVPVSEKFKLKVWT